MPAENLIVFNNTRRAEALAAGVISDRASTVCEDLLKRLNFAAGPGLDPNADLARIDVNTTARRIRIVGILDALENRLLDVSDQLAPKLHKDMSAHSQLGVWFTHQMNSTVIVGSGATRREACASAMAHSGARALPSNVFGEPPKWLKDLEDVVIAFLARLRPTISSSVTFSTGIAQSFQYEHQTSTHRSSTDFMSSARFARAGIVTCN